MNMNNQSSSVVGSTNSKSWGWLFVIGILLVILGIVCVAAPVVTTLFSMVAFGWLLIFSGILKIIYSFRFWKDEWSGFFVFLLAGLIYLVVGGLILYNPVTSAASLTLLLAVFFLVLGVFRIAGAIAFQLSNKAWVIVDGILAFILGVLILAHWPSSALWVIGLFIGIDLIFSGVTLLSLGYVRKKINL